MEITLKITADPVIMTALMTVYRTVAELGVAALKMMNAVSVVVIIHPVRIVRELPMVMLT